jgi:hypothetical protein
LLPSLAVFTHAPPQTVRPAPQVVWHWPFEHTWLVAQACPQPPQLAGSLVVVTQRAGLPQATVPTGQTHWPAAQIVPPEQTVPQAPQLPALDSKSTQAPLQVVSPVPQVPHIPWLHEVPAEQAVPQAPQLVGSDRRSTHLPPHNS